MLSLLQHNKPPLVFLSNSVIAEYFANFNKNSTLFSMTWTKPGSITKKTFYFSV